MDLVDFKDIDPQMISILIDRGTCSGKCPSYRLTLKASGELIFKGRAWVDMIGVVETTVDPSVVLKFVKILLDMNFFELPDTLTSEPLQPSPLSSTMIILSIGGRKKSIAITGVVQGRGLELESIATDIDEAVNSARWINRYQMLR